MLALPRAARLFVTVVVGCALVLGLAALQQDGPWVPIIVFAALYVIADSLPVGPGGATTGLSITVTTPVAIAAYVVLGVWGGILVALASVADLIRTTPVKRVFNAGQLALAAAAGGSIYSVLGGSPALGPEHFPAVLVPALVAGVVYTFVNTLLVGLIVALIENAPVLRLFRDILLRTLLPGVAYSALGLVLAVLWTQVGPFALMLGLLPLLVARWAMGQYSAEQQAYTATIRTLVQAVETKDAYTRGHSERVARAAVLVGRGLSVTGERLQALEYAGTLHDVGKLGVPTAVLRKTGRLTDEEFDAIKLHPTRGHDIVREIRFLDEALAGIYHHHERLDGLGYPDGLAGEQIPEFARMIAVADAFDSMTSTRSYRSARSVPEALDELQRCSGTQFDPTMVEALVGAVRRSGWEAAAPPTAEELQAQREAPLFDDDDPLVADDGWRGERAGPVLGPQWAGPLPRTQDRDVTIAPQQQRGADDVTRERP